MNLFLQAQHTKLALNSLCFTAIDLFVSFLKYHVQTWQYQHLFMYKHQLTRCHRPCTLHVLKPVVPSNCLGQIKNTWCNLSHCLIQNKPVHFHTSSPQAWGGDWLLCPQTTAVVGRQERCHWGGLGRSKMSAGKLTVCDTNRGLLMEGRCVSGCMYSGKRARRAQRGPALFSVLWGQKNRKILYVMDTMMILLFF